MSIYVEASFKAPAPRNDICLDSLEIILRNGQSISLGWERSSQGGGDDTYEGYFNGLTDSDDEYLDLTTDDLCGMRIGDVEWTCVDEDGEDSCDWFEWLKTVQITLLQIHTVDGLYIHRSRDLNHQYHLRLVADDDYKGKSIIVYDGFPLDTDAFASIPDIASYISPETKGKLSIRRMDPDGAMYTAYRMSVECQMEDEERMENRE